MSGVDEKVESSNVSFRAEGELAAEEERAGGVEIEETKREEQKDARNVIESVESVQTKGIIEETKEVEQPLEFIVQEEDAQEIKVEDDKVEDDNVEDSLKEDNTNEDNAKENKGEDEEIEHEKDEGERVEDEKVEDNKIEEEVRGSELKETEAKVEDEKTEEEPVNEDEVQDEPINPIASTEEDKAIEEQEANTENDNILVKDEGGIQSDDQEDYNKEVNRNISQEQLVDEEGSLEEENLNKE